jgi:hypothetical protein
MHTRSSIPIIAAATLTVGLIGSASLGRRAAPPQADIGALYLIPDRFQHGEGDHLTLSLLSRSHRDGAERAAEWRSISPNWFFARVAGTQENRQADFFPEGQQPIDLVLEHPGVTMLGFESSPYTQTVPADAFTTLARATLSDQEAEEVIGALPAGRDPRLRRVDSAKAIVATAPRGEPQPESSAAITESGQSVEIFLMADPTTVSVGSDIPVTISSGGGEESAGIRVFAATSDGVVRQEVVTNESGIAYIHITRPGVWRIEFRHAEPLRNDPGADIVLYTGTATFSVPAKTR